MGSSNAASPQSYGQMNGLAQQGQSNSPLMQGIMSSGAQQTMGGNQGANMGMGSMGSANNSVGNMGQQIGASMGPTGGMSPGIAGAMGQSNAIQPGMNMGSLMQMLQGYYNNPQQMGTGNNIRNPQMIQSPQQPAQMNFGTGNGGMWY